MKRLFFIRILLASIAIMGVLSSFTSNHFNQHSPVNFRDTIIVPNIQKEVDESLAQALKEIKAVDWEKVNSEIKNAIAKVDLIKIQAEVQNALKSVRFDEMQKALNESMKKLNSQQIQKEMQESLRQAQSELQKAIKDLNQQKEKLKMQEKELREQNPKSLLKKSGNPDKQSAILLPELLYRKRNSLCTVSPYMPII